MENLVKKILRVLKEHVKQNIKEIQYNQNDINHILSESASTKSSGDLDFKYALNKELLEENEDFIKMQFEINEFMDKYGHLFSTENDFEFEDKKSNGYEKINFFNKTVNGEIKFDPKHPQFNNPKFFQELLRYYQEKEDYEKCQELLKLKEIKR